MKPWINRLWVELFKLAWVKRLWASSFAAQKHQETAWTPLAKPLAQCRVALLTTGGVHLKNQEPFVMSDEKGDPSFREFPCFSPQEDLSITHDYYDHKDADQDINLLLPFAPLQRAVAEGLVGSAAPQSYSFMGHILADYLPQLHQNIQILAQKLKSQGVDLAILSPA